MPEDLKQTTDQLHDFFTVSQVCDVLNSTSTKVGNQLIIKHLTANLKGVKDLIEVYTQLEKISTSSKLNAVISEFKRLSKFVYLHVCKYSSIC